MKYNQPYGITDVNAPYINGNPSTGTMGSIPPAASIEYPQREIVNAITANGFTPDNADLFQLTRAVRRQAINYLVDTGGQNAMIVVPNPALEDYHPGLPLRVKVLHGNINDVSHTTLTLDAGLGAAPVRLTDGTLPLTNALPAGGIATMVFDGVNWQLTNTAVGSGGGTVNVTSGIPYTLDTGIVANAIIANFSPAITAIGAGGLTIEVKLANSLVNGACTIAVNGLAPKFVKNPNGNNPSSGDAIAGQVLLMVYDGVNFQLIGIVPTPTTRPTLIASMPAPGGQYVPNNTAVQVTSISNVMQSTLVTSTWSAGSVLTIGAGEDGLWAFTVGFSYGNLININATYAEARRQRASTPDFYFSVGYTPYSAVIASEVAAFGSGHAQLAVGDTVSFITSIWGSGGPYQILQAGPPSGIPVQPNVQAYRINRP
jgi:hypothetical protein